jgi:hypothetical protein
MIVKAGSIIAIFIHMAWERLALMYAILVPPGAVLLFVAIMAFESRTLLGSHSKRRAPVPRPRPLGPKLQGLSTDSRSCQARLEILRNPTRPFGLLRSPPLAPHSKTAKTGVRNKLLNEYLRKRDFASTPEAPPEPGGHAARSSSSGGSELHAE